MSNKRLLQECFGFQYDKKLITEAKQQQQPIIVPALLQRCDSSNSNGRIYPRAILEREIGRYQKLIAAGQSGGEIDHPADDPVTSLRNTAIAIREVWWEGNDIKGKVEVLYKVPAGQIILGLMESDLSIGLSSRGVGSTSLNESGKEVVEDDYSLICWDAVSLGSVTGAGFLKESTDLRKYLTEGFSLDHYITSKPIPQPYSSLSHILDDILNK